MYDLIILGAGPAGLTGALYACRAGLSTLVLERAFAGGQMSTTFEIENFPGVARAGGAELGITMEAQAKSFGAEIRTEEVSKIVPQEKTLLVRTDAGEYECRALIAAMGASRRLLGCKGESEFTGMGVSYCATCDGNFFRGKTVCVVGGGDTALEDAEYLANICAKVYLIHRRDAFRGSVYLQRRVLALKNVEPVYNSVVEEVYGRDSVGGVMVRNVETGERAALELSGVFVAIGTVPQGTLLRGIVHMDESGYVLAGEDCRTSDKRIFVAGDLRRKPLYQVVTAAADGAVAAKHAAEYIYSTAEQE